MFLDFFPLAIHIEATTIAGISLWSLALYLGFSSVGDWITEQLNRWFNFAEQALFLSHKEFEHTQPIRESLNALYASIFSIVPFLGIGTLCNYWVEAGLGRSWAISMGLLSCVSCGVYELGRRSTKTFNE